MWKLKAYSISRLHSHRYLWIVKQLWNWIRWSRSKSNFYRYLDVEIFYYIKWDWRAEIILPSFYDHHSQIKKNFDWFSWAFNDRSFSWTFFNLRAIPPKLSFPNFSHRTHLNLAQINYVKVVALIALLNDGLAGQKIHRKHGVKDVRALVLV